MAALTNACDCLENLHTINFNENFLEDNGARAFVGYLAKAKGNFRVLKAKGCSLADKSCEMMLKSQKENKNLKIREIHF